MLRLAAILFAASLAAAQPVTIRTLGQIQPPVGEGSAGRVLVLDQRGDETIVIRTRTPFYQWASSELAATRIAADGTTTTTSIAPIDGKNGIFAGDGVVTGNGYFVAWNDGGVQTAFIDSSLRLVSTTTLPASQVFRNIFVRCTERRCLVTWPEVTSDAQLAGALFDTSGNLLVPRIELGLIYRARFSRYYDVAASSSQFMIATWAESSSRKSLRVTPVDEDGQARPPVVTLDDQDFSPPAIDNIGEDFVVVRAEAAADDKGLIFSAKTIDRIGAPLQLWHDIASASDRALYALHLHRSPSRHTHPRMILRSWSARRADR